MAATTNTDPILFDQEIRFHENDEVEISTAWGWTAGVVTKVNHVNSEELNAHGYHYTVSYVPKWEKFGRAGLTACSGPAIRNRQ